MEPWLLMPPSTVRTWPVTYRDSTEARKSIAWAMSSGSPMKGRTLWLRIWSIMSVSRLSRRAGVMIAPGATALQRTCLRPYWVAMYCVIRMTAALAVP